MSPHNVQRQRVGRGTMLRFAGQSGSGLAFLEILDDRTGSPHLVACDNGPTCRALDEVFPGFIQPGHWVDSTAIAGTRVYWCEDEFGILQAFSTEEDAHPLIVAIYEGVAVIHGADIRPL